METIRLPTTNNMPISDLCIYSVSIVRVLRERIEPNYQKLNARSNAYSVNHDDQSNPRCNDLTLRRDLAFMITEDPASGKILEFSST